MHFSFCFTIAWLGNRLYFYSSTIIWCRNLKRSVYPPLQQWWQRHCRKWSFVQDDQGIVYFVFTFIPWQSSIRKKYIKIPQLSFVHFHSLYHSWRLKREIINYSGISPDSGMLVVFVFVPPGLIKSFHLISFKLWGWPAEVVSNIYFVFLAKF